MISLFVKFVTNNRKKILSNRSIHRDLWRNNEVRVIVFVTCYPLSEYVFIDMIKRKYIYV